MTANNEIKTKAKTNGVFLWEIAEKLGIADNAFSRKLRRELPQDEKQHIFLLIDEIAAEKKSAAQNAEKFQPKQDDNAAVCGIRKIY